ncbi:MAG: GNAT family N-acetyltransferase [Gemmatimonadota bacterium]
MRGSDARALLDDPGFVAGWDALLTSCPWATAFQAPHFARTWYDVYRDVYEPIIALERADGALAGLLLLARHRESGEVVHVGAHHAEYHTWLAPGGPEQSFIVAALSALAELDISLVRFLFLAPETPLEWTKDLPALGFLADVRWHSRGLMKVGEGSTIAASLKKSGNKSRLSRLKRSGEVEFVQIRSQDELAAAFDEIATQCDVRQGAVHDSLPFATDPLKRRLYLTLARDPDVMHCTVLRAGGKVVASHLGLRSGDMVSLGLITHAPQYGRASPGKLLILFLGQLLGEQGLEWFDMTPGEGYKDRFATDHDDVAVLDVMLNPSVQRRFRIRRRVVTFGRKLGQRLGRDLLGSVRFAAAAVRIHGPVGAVARGSAGGMAWVASREEFVLFRRSIDTPVPEPSNGTTVRFNELDDLLLYEPATSSDPRLTDFLSAAVSRLERGDLMATVLRDGALIHCGWLSVDAKKVWPTSNHRLDIDGGISFLQEGFTHPNAGPEVLRTSLIERLRVATERSKGGWCGAAVMPGGAPSRRLLEELGFDLAGTAGSRVRRGDRSYWSDVQEPYSAPEPDPA